MNDLLFNIVWAVIIALAGVFARYFIPWIKEVIEGTKLEGVLTWAYKFVQAAEQTITDGVDKKTYVIEQLRKILLAKKLALSEEQISALIEGIVNELYPKGE